jgi:hypothetical protein
VVGTVTGVPLPVTGAPLGGHWSLFFANVPLGPSPSRRTIRPPPRGAAFPSRWSNRDRRVRRDREACAGGNSRRRGPSSLASAA